MCNSKSRASIEYFSGSGIWQTVYGLRPVPEHIRRRTDLYPEMVQVLVDVIGGRAWINVLPREVRFTFVQQEEKE